MNETKIRVFRDRMRDLRQNGCWLGVDHGLGANEPIGGGILRYSIAFSDSLLVLEDVLPG